jgi:hypothetical protein
MSLLKRNRWGPLKKEGQNPKNGLFGDYITLKTYTTSDKKFTMFDPMSATKYDYNMCLYKCLAMYMCHIDQPSTADDIKELLTSNIGELHKKYKVTGVMADEHILQTAAKLLNIKIIVTYMVGQDQINFQSFDDRVFYPDDIRQLECHLILMQHHYMWLKYNKD